MGSFMHGLWLPRTAINPKVIDPVSYWCEKDVTLGCEEHLSQVRFGPGALGISENIPIGSQPDPPGQFGHGGNFKTPPAQDHPMWTS